MSILIVGSQRVNCEYSESLFILSMFVAFSSKNIIITNVFLKKMTKPTWQEKRNQVAGMATWDTTLRQVAVDFCAAHNFLTL